MQRATDRIAALADRPDPPSPRRAPHVPVPAGPDLAELRELFLNEQFAAAFDRLQELPPERSSDPDVLLLRALILAHVGSSAAAEEACRRLLAADAMHAGAHYVLGLCREGAGDVPGALEHHRLAVALDPGFAMSHLRLGLLARRSGDLALARRALGHALALLPREDRSRLRLFGGGFGGDALAALCDAELAACGGRP